VQALSFFVAGLGIDEVAAHNSLVALLEVLSRIIDGMGDALQVQKSGILTLMNWTTPSLCCQVRVGYHLGKQAIDKARATCFAASTFSMIWALLVFAVLYGCKDNLGRMYADGDSLRAGFRQHRALRCSRESIVDDQYDLSIHPSRAGQLLPSGCIFSGLLGHCHSPMRGSTLGNARGFPWSVDRPLCRLFGYGRGVIWFRVVQ